MMLPNILQWGNVGKQKIQTLMILLIIIYLFQYHFIEYLYKKTGIYVGLDGYCIRKCSSQTCKNMVTNYRNSDYWAATNLSPTNCAITAWEIAHTILHIFIGYYYNIHMSVLLSVGHELYEHYYLDRGSYLDLFYNMMGFVIGYSFKQI